ncbi:fumarylacetoacetate hydrolase family protein [Candidatus Poriferisodalis sp.]|uniref:fumarylacetoacetate hydrolase family protein n=1 Tax=Candidatus Poriferisodalis sp. TaxID=3101277 RepID=UPI003B01949A
MPFALANVDGRAALVASDSYYDLETVSQGSVGSDPMAALESAGQLAALSDRLDAHQPTGSLADAQLHAPVPAPRNSYGIGLNYRSHAAEANMNVPEAPLVFTKFPSCIVGPYDDVELRSERVDYEGEIVVVIGPGGKDIHEADAWSHVLGLTAGQDVSDRGMQMASKPPHFDLGKSFDTFGPIGPLLVSTDSFADLEAVRVTTRINGEERQNDTTASLMFSIPTLVSYLSRITTLRTGDVIFSGTPEGIGAVQGLFLTDGDVITTTVEGVGTMTNRCVRVSDHCHPTPNFPPR